MKDTSPKHSSLKENFTDTTDDSMVEFIHLEPLYKVIIKYPSCLFETWRGSITEEHKYGPPYIENELLEEAFLEEVSIKKVSYLSVHECLTSKINPNIFNDKDTNKHSAFHYAARYGNMTLAKMLLRAEADVEKPNGLGQTPLMIACAGKYPRHTKIVRLLLSHGVDIDCKDRGGSTALSQCITSSNVNTVRELLLHGAAVIEKEKTLSNLEGKDVLSLAKIIRAKEARVKLKESDEYFARLKKSGPSYWDRVRKKRLCSSSNEILNMLDKAIAGEFVTFQGQEEEIKGAIRTERGNTLDLNAKTKSVTCWKRLADKIGIRSHWKKSDLTKSSNTPASNYTTGEPKQDKDEKKLIGRAKSELFRRKSGLNLKKDGSHLVDKKESNKEDHQSESTPSIPVPPPPHFGMMASHRLRNKATHGSNHVKRKRRISNKGA